MKKKIKDLTIEEILKICEKRQPCKECPFDNGFSCKLHTNNYDKIKDKEIDL